MSHWNSQPDVLLAEPDVDSVRLPLPALATRRAPLPISIVIPARQEEANLPLCLEAALASGAAEVHVVDDNSTDATPAILHAWQAREPRRLHIHQAGALPLGWTGKNHAVAVGAAAARQPWLLFLDADVQLLPGALAAALAYAEAHELSALSLSPEQELGTLAERIVMPAVFAELAEHYPFERVSDPHDRLAAANGQFILIRRADYWQIGGHAAVRDVVLEDVRLAEHIKAAGLAFHFRPGTGWARTRMYRDPRSLWHGWRKNLRPLLGTPLQPRFARLLLAPALAVLTAAALAAQFWALGLALFSALFLLHWEYRIRLRRIGFDGARWLLPACLALAAMWAASALRRHRRLPVVWKGRLVPLPVESRDATRHATSYGSGPATRHASGPATSYGSGPATSYASGDATSYASGDPSGRAERQVRAASGGGHA